MVYGTCRQRPRRLPPTRRIVQNIMRYTLRTTPRDIGYGEKRKGSVKNNNSNNKESQPLINDRMSEMREKEQLVKGKLFTYTHFSS